MRAVSVMLAFVVLASLPCLACAEQQIRDRSGRVVEIRQEYGGTTYAYDPNRNFIYSATLIKGGGGALDYRDSHGVHVGVGGPGTLPWSVRGKW
jgi:hypothetical protein